MDIHQALRVCIDQGLGDDPHPTGHHHQIHRSGLEAVDQRLVQGLAVGEETVVMERAGHTEAGGALFSTATGIVHHQLAHGCSQLPAPACPHQRFKVAARP